MKRQIVGLLCIITVGTALFCGCGQKPDPKIAALQKQVDVLTDMMEQNHVIATNAMSLALSTFKLADNNTTDESDIITKLEHYYRATTNIEARLEHLELLEQIREQGKPGSLSTLQRAAHGVMPAEVAAEIRAEAERCYPTDYDMQIFVIKEQTEAWQKLHP